MLLAVVGCNSGSVNVYSGVLENVAHHTYPKMELQSLGTVSSLQDKGLSGEVPSPQLPNCVSGVWGRFIKIWGGGGNRAGS